jgi:hypothetical protein
MDPATLSIVMRALAPVLGMLAFATLPIGILYILKSHKVRMRELDLEAQMLLPRNAETRLAAIETRLAAIEQAVGVPSPKGLQERAALLEGPALTAGAEAAPLVRARER